MCHVLDIPHPPTPTPCLQHTWLTICMPRLWPKAGCLFSSDLFVFHCAPRAVDIACAWCCCSMCVPSLCAAHSLFGFLFADRILLACSLPCIQCTVHFTCCVSSVFSRLQAASAAGDAARCAPRPPCESCVPSCPLNAASVSLLPVSPNVFRRDIVPRGHDGPFHSYTEHLLRPKVRRAFHWLHV